MQASSIKAPDAATRRRNRMLLWVLIAVVFGSAAWGTLFLRHYGFNTKTRTEKFH